ncbi:tyrosine recombinase XerC [Pelomonas sp. KK5]|uniref:site-specific integrase n=1 Tax=Pelomonas sp. KK5 TaxID=1855730 RepID=UPI001301D21A|nr:tyrosine-type recombinase/integrase [Pelomonas sp. KK5]
MDTSYFEDRYQAYVKAKRIPPDVLEQNPDMVKEGHYLTPTEQKALAILRTPEDAQGQPRLSDALAIYLATHQNTANKRATDRAARDWGHLVSLAGDIPVLALVREHARSYVVQRTAKGSKTATVRRAVNTVNAVLNVAIRELDIKGAINPFAAVLIPNEGRDTKDVKTPSARELREVLEAHRDDRSTPALLIRLQLATGARIAEVAGLGVGDVVLSGDTPYIKFQVHPWRPLKNAHSVRNVPLVGDALEAARHALDTAMSLPGGTGTRTSNFPLFPQYARNANGGATASATVNKRLSPWAFNSHGFRHGMKDVLREVGCPEPIQKAIQGHAGDGISAGYGEGYSRRMKAEWLTKAMAHIEGAL